LDWVEAFYKSRDTFPIFHDDADRQRFIDTLGEACGKTGWEVHAYCLMPNHFHLVVETPQPNLVAGMKWFLGTYTGRFNMRFVADSFFLAHRNLTFPISTHRDHNHYGSGAGSGMRRPEQADRK